MSTPPSPCWPSEATAGATTRRIAEAAGISQVTCSAIGTSASRSGRHPCRYLRPLVDNGLHHNGRHRSRRLIRVVLAPLGPRPHRNLLVGTLLLEGARDPDVAALISNLSGPCRDRRKSSPVPVVRQTAKDPPIRCPSASSSPPDQHASAHAFPRDCGAPMPGQLFMISRRSPHGNNGHFYHRHVRLVPGQSSNDITGHSTPRQPLCTP